MSGLYEAVAARITAECPAAAQARAATAAAEADAEVLGPAPSVLVVPAAERYQPVREAGLHVSQRGSIGFSCVVALTFPGGYPQWTAIRGELIATLAGWTPPDSGFETELPAAPVEYAGARLLSYAAELGGRWLHAFDFTLPVQRSYPHQS
ncbi:MAG: hypothetical protein KIS81_00635 [Maricaulaceae bacterium]|nr:hypothetical protein [Maricaulaceae bacterium]